MVKTLPTVERSTQIRFGKHAQQDQGENTIVLNASNTAVDASTGGALYVSPVRFRPDYEGKAEIVLMMYNTLTKELTESGESAQDLIGNQGFQAVTNQGNTTSNNLIFYNNVAAFVTTGNVGIANSLASHTLSVGSNVYIDDKGINVLVVSGGVGITDTTTSTSATTGALKVAGGISTEENLNVGAVTKVLSATDSTSKTTGALIVTGGVGISKNIHGKNVFVEDVVSNSVVILDTTTSSSATTGALQVAGGISTQENLNVGAVAKVLSATDASSKTTGALIVTGGVGISKNIHALNANFEGVEADSVNITDTTPSNNQTSGALKVAGGLGVAGNVHCGNLTLTGNLTVTGNTTVFNSNNLIIQDPVIELGKGNLAGLDTGLVMNNPLTSGNKGNVAVIYDFSTSNLEIGHTLNSATDTVIVMNTANTLPVNINGTLGVTGSTTSSSKTTGAVTIGGGLGVVGDIHATDVNFEDVEADRVTITDNTTSTSATTGALKVVGGISTQENLNVGAVAKVISGTDATSKTTGALIVTGGVGISKNIHGKNVFVEDIVSNSVVILDTTTSDSATTGALKVVGGISTQENLNVGAVTKVFSATDATSKTTGALIVTGGLGVAKNIHGKNVFVEDVVSNSVVILDTTTSTSVTTGALKVTGGISTQEKLNVGGITKVWADTTATSKTTGAVQIVGGLGVGGAIFGETGNFGGSITVAGDLIVSGETISQGQNSLTVADPTIEVGIGNVNGADVGMVMNNPLTGGHKGNVAIIYDFSASNLEIGHTLNSSADSTITMNTANTLAVNINGTLGVTGSTTSSSKTTGAVTIGGGVGISGALFGAAATLDGVVTLTDDTTSTSTTTGALKVTGGISTQENLHAAGMIKGATISGTNVYGTLAGANTAAVTTLTATSVTASAMVKGATISGTNVYGTLAGANTAAVTTLTASGMVKGATISGTNVYGTLAGANTAAVTTLTASGMVKGATISGTNVYGTLAGANTAAVTTLTASGMVKGATISGTNVYGTLAGANTAAVTTLTASAMVKGATISGTNVYGTLAGSNAAAITTLNASGVVTLADTTTSTSATTGALKVAGGISTQENLNVGGDLKVDTSVLVVNSTTDRVGINKAAPAYSLDVVGDINFTGDLYEGGELFVSTPWTIESSPTALSYTSGNVGVGAINPAAKLTVTGDAQITTTLNVGGVVTLTDTTESTSSTTGALKAAGGVGIAKDVYVGERAHVTGGLITNTGGFGKKTYSYSTNLTSGASVANATYVLDFTNHAFHAKVTAMLIESADASVFDQVSTMTFDVIGGKIGGSGNSQFVPALGQINVISTSTMNTPWDSTIATALAGTTVTIKPANACNGVVRFNIFVEYLCHESGGRLTSINCSGNSPDSGDLGY